MQALRFEGSGMEYFKIWIVNVLLTIVTAGLYYPWAKVRNHRYFYANSTLDGKNFEYHATGKQLFIGYLIALLLFIIYVVIQQFSPEGSIAIAVLLFLAIPWIIWRSMKFNMRMSSYSNVRFGFEGTLGGSYFNFLVLPFLLLLSVYIAPIAAFILGKSGGESVVGILVPVLAIIAFGIAIYMYSFLKKKNATYILNGTRYGQGEFETNLKTKKFLIILLKTIGFAILGMFAFFTILSVVAAMVIGAEGLQSFQEGMEDPEQIKELMKGPMLGIMIGVIYLMMIFGSMLVMAYSLTRQRKYVYENTTLDEKITFASTLKARSLIWVMISNLIVIILTLGFAIPWAKVRMARLMLEHTEVSTDEGFDTYVTQKQKEESSLGEQIGDAFDVDVGLGF